MAIFRRISPRPLITRNMPANVPMSGIGSFIACHRSSLAPRVTITAIHSLYLALALPRSGASFSARSVSARSGMSRSASGRSPFGGVARYWEVVRSLTVEGSLRA
jgi:hypothetical protein